MTVPDHPCTSLPDSGAASKSNLVSVMSSGTANFCISAVFRSSSVLRVHTALLSHSSSSPTPQTGPTADPRTLLQERADLGRCTKGFLVLEFEFLEASAKPDPTSVLQGFTFCSSGHKV